MRRWSPSAVGTESLSPDQWVCTGCPAGRSLTVHFTTLPVCPVCKRNYQRNQDFKELVLDNQLISRGGHSLRGPTSAIFYFHLVLVDKRWSYGQVGVCVRGGRLWTLTGSPLLRNGGRFSIQTGQQTWKTTQNFFNGSRTSDGILSASTSCWVNSAQKPNSDSSSASSCRGRKTAGEVDLALMSHKGFKVLVSPEDVTLPAA